MYAAMLSLRIVDAVCVAVAHTHIAVFYPPIYCAAVNADTYFDMILRGGWSKMKVRMGKLMATKPLNNAAVLGTRAAKPEILRLNSLSLFPSLSLSLSLSEAHSLATIETLQSFSACDRTSVP